MPLSTKIATIIAGVISIPVFGGAIIAANYQSPILEHLVDIVNGSNTTVVASLNAPNWSYGIPLPTVVGVTAATTTGGTVASSTPFTFAVVALDGTGTTTMSAIATATTDASTSPNEQIQINWGSVPGATGYAVFFATSSSATASTLTQYFYATTTGAFTFATSTGSLFGSYAKTDTTAFSVELNPLGPDYINGPSTSTTTPSASSTVLQLNGNFVVTAPATTTNCFAGTAGAIFYNTANAHEWGCNGTAWQKIF